MLYSATTRRNLAGIMTSIRSHMETDAECAHGGDQLVQPCLALCDPMDCSLPGSSVHGILQARVLEWVAIPSFRGSFPSRDQPASPLCPASQADSSAPSHRGSPKYCMDSLKCGNFKKSASREQKSSCQKLGSVEQKVGKRVQAFSYEVNKA